MGNVVKRRTHGAKRYNLRDELLAAYPFMSPTEAGAITLLAHVLGDMSVTYAWHTVFIVNGRIVK
jgi:hypothetical protein